MPAVDCLQHPLRCGFQQQLRRGVRRRRAERRKLVSEQNKRLVHKITAVIWNSRGLDRIPEFYTPDFVGDYRPYALREDDRAGDLGTDPSAPHLPNVKSCCPPWRKSP